MKNFPLAPNAGNVRTTCFLLRRASAAVFAGLLSIALPLATSHAQPSQDQAAGEEVLARGPVHEAFAAVVSYNPSPGIVVKARPPEQIAELPPEEKPVGDDVAWIPGYWGWDDERNDYLWISGTWRIPPPGRAWMAGYWREGDDGYQWISGYWADATAAETTYLPTPPATLEVGPNGDAPSADYGWSPGCWIWQQDRYAWRAGYWAEGRADWVWSPAYYVWTPRGAIFVGGFWDYPVEQRGILFAPVYYQSRGYARRGYTYSPRIAINLSLFLDNLFLRPSYHHYYFGDYYGSRYEQDGFYASIAFQSSRQGFEPFYAHDRWEHRADRGWAQRFRASYQDRRLNESARPPRTWSAQASGDAGGANGGQVRLQLTMPLGQLAHRPDGPVRFQPVAREERQKIAERGQQVQASRDERRTVEAKGVVAPGRRENSVPQPVRVASPRSPIAARPDIQRGTKPALPERPQAARPQPPAQPKAEAQGSPTLGDRSSTVPVPDERKALTAREHRPGATAPAPVEPSRKDPPSQAIAVPAAGQPNRNPTAVPPQPETAPPQPASDRAQDPAPKARGEAQRRVNESQAGAPQNDPRANVPGARARDESPRKDQPAPARVQSADERRGREAAGPTRTPAKEVPAEEAQDDGKNDKERPRR